MGAQVWRDDQGKLRCRRSPGGTEWVVHQGEVQGFVLVDPDTSAGTPPLPVGRRDPDTAEAIIKFLLREERTKT